jgi:hypothetical protein
VTLLTTTNRQEFTAGQLNQLDKLSPRRLDEYVTKAPVDSGMTDAEYKRAMIAKLKLKSPEQLRARVNLILITGSGPKVVAWATPAEGGDYSDVEKASIEDLLNRGGKFEDIAVRVEAGERSVEQRLAVLEGR